MLTPRLSEPGALGGHPFEQSGEVEEAAERIVDDPTDTNVDEILETCV